MFEDLMAQDKEGSSERWSEEQGEVQSEFVGVLNAEW